MRLTVPRTVQKIGVALALLGLAAVGLAQELEQGVKAAFIYHFTKYVDWPTSAFDGTSSPIVIGVLGDRAANTIESAVAGKSVGSRRIVVRRFKWNQDLGQCQILFVSADEMSNAGLLCKLKNHPVLTIGESSGFARKYGIINFVIEADHVRFEINAQAARESGLSISSKLLNLAKAPS